MTRCFVTCLLMAVESSSALAGWVPGGVPIVMEHSARSEPLVATDGAGGLYAAWLDGPYPGSVSIRVQHLGSSGERLWGPRGLEVIGPLEDNSRIRFILPDGQSGAVVCFSRGGNESCLLRVNPEGRVIYLHCPIAAASLVSADPGAVLAMDDRFLSMGETQGDIIAQFWSLKSGTGGPSIPACLAEGTQSMPQISMGRRVSSDGRGGAILWWNDSRGIFIQRISSAGEAVWGIGGLPVDSTFPPGFPWISGDSQGGAFVSWFRRTADGGMVSAQHFDSLGIAQWTMPMDLPVFDYPLAASVEPDGQGGAWMVGARSTISPTGGIDIVVQHISDTEVGTPVLLHRGGSFIATSGSTKGLDVFVADGGLRLIRIEIGRNLPLGPDGMKLFDEPYQWSVDPGGITRTDTGEYLVAWLSRRSDGNLEMLASRVGVDGNSPTPDISANSTGILMEVRPLPNPAATGVTRLHYQLTSDARVSMRVVDLLGRTVRDLVRDEPMLSGFHSVDWDGRTDSGSRVPAGVYFVIETAGNATRSSRLVVTR